VHLFILFPLEKRCSKYHELAEHVIILDNKDDTELLFS
jgi:hypothetical protein